MKGRFKVFATAILTCVLVLKCSVAQAQQIHPEVVVVDAAAPAHPFPHFWEQMFGSGRAILSLRDSYRRDLRDVKKITDFKYVRFHGIFLDEVGVYDENSKGQPIYNFSYVDQIYDGLLSNGIKPFVELSFMPKKLVQTERFPTQRLE
jgi:xylan 1,4-beta-xylosidase